MAAKEQFRGHVDAFVLVLVQGPGTHIVRGQGYGIVRGQGHGRMRTRSVVPLAPAQPIARPGRSTSSVNTAK
jgi:hypothetical protein